MQGLTIKAHQADHQSPPKATFGVLIAEATRSVLEALGVSVDAELLRYGPEIQAAEARAILAERHANIQSAAARLAFSACAASRSPRSP